MEQKSLEKNKIHSHISTVSETPKTKVKLHCCLSDSWSDVDLEVDNKISIGTLKRKIVKEMKFTPETKFNLIYNDKNFTDFNKLRLNDLLSDNSDDEKTEDGSDSKLNKTEPSSPKKAGKICPQNIKFDVISKDNLSELSAKSVGSRYKKMLECDAHFNENAHFYCADCNLSFCALCIENHSAHEFIDKYDYTKSKSEIVKGILKSLVGSLQEKRKEESFNIIYDKILFPEKETSINSKLLDKEIINTIKSIWTLYNDYSIQNKENIAQSIEQKLEDFNQNLMKFKAICINNIKEAQKSQDQNDIITLGNEYFVKFNKTLKELNVGKEALINYLEIRNKEIDFDLNSSILFDSEILSDLQKISSKIKNKLSFSKQQAPNLSANCDSLNSSSISEYGTIKNEGLEIEEMKDILEGKLSEESNGLNPRDGTLDSNGRNSGFEGGALVASRSEAQIRINKLIEEDEELKGRTTFVMKRKLLKEMYVYDMEKEEFKVVKEFSSYPFNFKRFLQFSIYLNAKNCLFISGGKSKDDKVSRSFYCYNYATNKLEVLPEMLKARCSHSMIYL